MVSVADRAIIERARNGEDLTDDEMTDLYCAVPDVLSERDGFANMLKIIAEHPLSENPTQYELNMQQIATRALGAEAMEARMTASFRSLGILPDQTSRTP